MQPPAVWQEDDDFSEPCGSEMGEMMTPPQPAPRDGPQEGMSDTEMSFKDLVDDSDEEEQEARRPGHRKAGAGGQVLVDPEDLQVNTQLLYAAGACLIYFASK